MAFQYPNNRVPTTKDGIPYVWGGGDTTTMPSNELKLVHPNPGAGDGLTSGWIVRNQFRARWIFKPALGPGTSPGIDLLDLQFLQ